MFFYGGQGRRRRADGEVCRGVGLEERGGRRAAYLVPSVWEHPVSWDVLEKEAGGGMRVTVGHGMFAGWRDKRRCVEGGEAREKVSAISWALGK